MESSTLLSFDDIVFSMRSYIKPEHYGWNAGQYRELSAITLSAKSSIDTEVGYVKISLPIDLRPRHRPNERHRADCYRFKISQVNGRLTDGTSIPLMWNLERQDDIGRFSDTKSELDTAVMGSVEFEHHSDAGVKARAYFTRMERRLATASAGEDSALQGYDAVDSIAESDYDITEMEDTLGENDGKGFLPHCRYRSNMYTFETEKILKLGLSHPFKSPLEPLAQADLLQRTVTFIPSLHRGMLFESAKGGGLFRLHKEDFGLMSANYCYFGRRVWTIIHQSSIALLEQKLRRFLKQEGISLDECDQWVQHQELFLSSSFLDRAEVKYDVVLQDEGDMIITSGYCYHQGICVGRTFSEAMSLAPNGWNIDAIDTMQCNERCTKSPLLKESLRFRNPSDEMEGIPEVLRGLYGLWN